MGHIAWTARGDQKPRASLLIWASSVGFVGVMRPFRVDLTTSRRGALVQLSSGRLYDAKACSSSNCD